MSVAAINGVAVADVAAISAVAAASIAAVDGVPFSSGPAGLLDSLTSGLWAAAGQRLLIGSYAGSCMRVRRSSDNTEADIGFDSGALDQTALLAHCGAGDGFVVTWYDQSGNGNHFTQATTTLQPAIVTGGVYLGSVQFDGSNDFMGTTATTSGTNDEMALAYKGNWRSAPGAGVFWAAIEHTIVANNYNACVMGTQDASGDKWFRALTQGATIRVVTNSTAATTDITALGTVVGIFKQGSTGNWVSTMSYNSVSFAGSNTLTGTMANGVLFTAAACYIGGRQSIGTQRGPFNLYDFAIYEANPSSAALHTALT